MECVGAERDSLLFFTLLKQSDKGRLSLEFDHCVILHFSFSIQQTFIDVCCVCHFPRQAL